MYAWFTDFSREVSTIWRSTVKYGAVTEHLTDIGDEPDIEHYDINYVAESFAAERLSRDKGYTAIVAPGRKTPAQVWGILDYENYTHLMLVTVKTTYKDQPAVIDIQKEKHSLEHLCVLVLKTFLKSDHVPKAAKEKNIVVSTGLAEVALNQGADDMAPEIRSTYFLGAFFDRSFDTDKGMKLFFRDAHSL